MTRNCRLSLLTVALVLTLATLAGICQAASPGVSPEDAKQIMPISQLKRGMRGYGLTVFQGTKIEKFDVEILGVLKQQNTGKDLILVRIGGGPINTRETGIIAGMSGSPVYINGKIVGAVAYGGQFTKEPVGMLTPIADMLEAWDSGLPKNASGYSSPQSLIQPMTLNGRTVNSVEIDEPGSSVSESDDGVLRMQPLMTPLMVSGISARGIERLADILRPFHIKPMAGPGGGPKDAGNPALVPGAAMGMSLASGDIDMSAIGTLTYRRGSKIVGFGHPMLGIGAIDAPLTTAYVDDVMSSYRVSSKMASPIKTVGRIFQDRPWSIAGIVGEQAKTIPATIQVDDRTSSRNKTFHVNVINHPLLASRILTMVVGEAIFNTHPTPGDATAEVSYEVVADQIGKIARSNTFFDPTSIDGAAIGDVGLLLQLLSSNRFYPLDVKSLNVKVKILDKRNTATIDRIFVKKGEYEPGETVEVGVVMRPYKKDRVTKTFSVKIPATAADGKVTLMVRGGATPSMMQMSAAAPAGDEGSDAGAAATIMGGGSDLMTADNVKQLVSKYLQREKNNEVVVQLMMRSTAINVAGEKLTGLPTAIADVMKSSRNSGLRLERDEVKQTFAEDTIIFGTAQLSVNVKKKDLNESKSASKAPVVSISSDEMDSSVSSMSSDYDMSEYSTYGRGSAESMDAEPSATVEEKSAPEATEEDAKPQTDSLGVASDPKSDEPAKTEEAKTDAKTVVRQAKSWSQRTQADFAKGTFSGASASSENKLELVPTLKKVMETPDQFVWCVAPAKDGVYAGTGNSGKVYHISDDGKMQLFYETGELEVHSLVRDSGGNVYAATSPNGKVFKISPDGKGKVVLTTDEKYVLALALDQEGNVYAGVGSAGKVYRITPAGNSSVFAELNEQQVLSLNWDVHGSLLVGTGINGNVYRVDKSGKASPIFDAPEDSITSIVSDGLGNVYAGTSPKGSVYKITPDGRSKAVYTNAARVLSMACDSLNNVYAVSDGTLVKIAPDGTVIQLDSAKDKVEFLALTFNEMTHALYAGTGNIGSVYISKCCDVAGQYESPVHDAQMISKWARIKWNAVTPEGTSVELQTRTGNVATPDATWSDWSPAYTNSAGEQIAGAPGRYVQYRVTLRSTKENVSPKVSGVTISYLTPNQAPTVKIAAPVGGEAWAGKETIKWTGSDPDKDTTTYDVFYSADGKDWKPLVGGVSATASTPTQTNKKTEPEVTAKVKAELEKSKDVPEDMKKQVLKDLPNAPKGGQPTTDTASGPSAPSSSSTSHTWDTAKVADGRYVIKVVASDKTSNGTGSLTGEAISEPVVVCNTAPKLSLSRNKVEVKGSSQATITGTATSSLVEIVGVQYKVDGGSWMAAAAKDGIYDSSSAEFTVTTDNLTAGTHKVEVQAVDAAGNAASGTVEVKVS